MAYRFTPEVEFISQDEVRFNSGQVLKKVHRPDECLGDVCAIHKPTDHYLRGELLSFNGKHMIRMVGEDVFVDPDDYTFLRSGQAIIRNAAQCYLCKDVVESFHTHDMDTCRCGEIFVDGGHEYLRRGANDLKNIIDMSVVFTLAKASE